MKKKTPIVRIVVPQPAPIAIADTWHRGADVEINFYAQSLQRAAKVLLANMRLELNPKTAWEPTS